MPFEKGYTPWNKGKGGIFSHSEESKKKMTGRPREGYYKQCLVCEESFYVSPSVQKQHCSWKCYSSTLFGEGNSFYRKHHTEESKRQLSLSHLGIPNPKVSIYRKKMFREHPEIAERHSRILKEGGLLKGPKNPNWRGGKSFESYGEEWTEDLKEKVRDRDNHTCQLCDKKYKRRKMVVHHIDHQKKNNRMDNLITLCMKCHSKIHHTLYSLKKSGKTIIYSFMCNDLFHIGHLKHIQRAGKMGDYLIVGILTDEAVASYKRNPIIPFKERVELTKAVRGVNWVVTQHLRNPLDNLRILKPDILIHGDDWDPDIDEDLKASKEYIESAGGKLVLTPYHKSQDTTKIIEKILDEAGEIKWN